MHNSPGKTDRDFFVFVLNAKKIQMNRPHWVEFRPPI